MPKIYFFILIFLGIVIFATTDYFFNVRTTTSPISSLVTDVNSTEADSNLIQSLLNQDSSLNYQIANRNRTTYVFEKFDASNMKNMFKFNLPIDFYKQFNQLIYPRITSGDNNLNQAKIKI